MATRKAPSRKILFKDSTTPFKLSRSKLELFMDCPRCFYADRKWGISRPPGFPFTLNSAVDALLKKEFDYYRDLGKPHPLMIENKIKAVPYQHSDLERWRNNLKGIQYHHEKTNLILFGAIDDLWIDAKGQLIVVDYKATSKDKEVTIDEEWQISYKRQMDVYRWLFKQCGFKVSPLGYFVYCNGLRNKSFFEGRLEFKISLIPYKGDESWIEKGLKDLKKLLESKTPPPLNEDCDFCSYIEASSKKL
jgi:CRISPR/Cas system-associated exonuclease Cas4 (RecB family)